MLALYESAMTAAGAAGRATPPPDIGGAAEDDADAPAEGQPAKRKPSTRRPPAPLSPTGVAAAVRAGMQSAGLAWLKAADAADAATSTGGAHGGSRPATETETRGRADTDVPLHSKRTSLVLELATRGFLVTSKMGVRSTTSPSSNVQVTRTRNIHHVTDTYSTMRVTRSSVHKPNLVADGSN